MPSKSLKAAADARWAGMLPVETLAVIADGALDAIIVTDTLLDEPGPRIVYANEAFVRMTGWTIDEILGRSPRMLQGAATELTVLASLRAACERCEPWQGSTVNYRRSGEAFVMEWRVFPVIIAGTVRQFVAVQRDLGAPQA